MQPDVGERDFILPNDFQNAIFKTYSAPLSNHCTPCKKNQLSDGSFRIAEGHYPRVEKHDEL